jgi:WD40 repeat protein
MSGHFASMKSVVVFMILAQVVQAQASGDSTPVDAAAARPGKMFKGPSAVVSSVSHSGSSGMIAAGYFNSTVQVWNTQSSDPLELKGHENWITAVAWSPTGPLLASAGLDKKIILWQLPTKKPTRVIEGAAAPAPGQPPVVDKHTDWIRALAFSTDGKLLVSAGDDKSILVWNVESGTFARRLEGSTEWVMCLAVSPDGKHVAAAGFDRTIRIWDVSSGTKVGEFPANHQIVIALAWSPDGKIIVSGGQDKKIRVWDATAGTELRVIDGHTDQVFAVAIHPNGRWLASCSADKSVRLWNLADGKEAKSLTGHTNWVYSLTFTSDGTSLATASADETVRLWDLTASRPAPASNGAPGN